MNGKFDLMWGVLALPIIGFLIQALGGRWLTKKVGIRVVGFLAVLPIALAFLIAAKSTMDLSGLDSAKRSVVLAGFPWIQTSELRIPFELLIDPLSMTMVLIITGVGGLIHLYATGYMANEREFSRFFAYLNLFVASMLILVLGNNLGLLFLGWEGVGLCSYLLIGFWYKDLPNAKAANKAFIVNRVGDWGLGLGIASIFALLASNPAKVPDGRFLSYDVMLGQLQIQLARHPIEATVIALLLFVGAAGKSAQFPLYLWLPDAMAGPTPVSALIHAATMVTSGVVLLNRMHIVFENSELASAVVVILGIFTALFAAIIAFGQTDIKKVLAYSTVSQLGFMFIACGTGNYWAGMFHVTTHAFFKALLFLGAGAVIHAMSHNQDMRNYGRLSKYLPITTWTMVIGWLAIAAVALPIGEQIFGFSGAYSKEAILGGAIGSEFPMIGGYRIGFIAGYLGLGVALLTSVYMTRLMYLTFFGKEERWRSVTPEHEGAAEEHPYQYDPSDTEPQTSLPGMPHWDPHGFYFERAVRYPDEADHAHELEPDHTPHEVPPSMWIPLVALAMLSAAGGFVLAKGDAFKTWLYPTGLNVLDEPAHEVANLALYSAIAAIGGVVLGILFYSKGLPKDQGWNEGLWKRWRLLARNQFGFDDAVTLTAVDGGGELARGIWRFIDVGFVDGLVMGTASVASFLSTILKKIQTGYVRLYALVMLVGGVGFLGYLFFALHQLGGSR